MDDMRKWLNLVNETDEVDENKFTDFFNNQEKKDHKFRQSIGQERATAIDRLADKIEELGLTQETIAMIDKVSSGFLNAFSKESVEHDAELVEKYIDDKSIKQVLLKIIKIQANADRPDPYNKTSNINQYVQKWSDALEKAYTNMRDMPRGSEFTYDGVRYHWAGAMWLKYNENNKQVPVSVKKGDPSNIELTNMYLKRTGQDYDIDQLTREMIDFLADRKDSAQWGHAARTVKQVISKFANAEESKELRQKIDNGEYMEKIMYDALTPVLEAAGGEWIDFGWKPTHAVDGYMVMEACVPKRDMLLADFLTDVIMHDKITKLKLKYTG